jgi:hypothetical protein
MPYGDPRFETQEPRQRTPKRERKLELGIRPPCGGDARGPAPAGMLWRAGDRRGIRTKKNEAAHRFACRPLCPCRAVSCLPNSLGHVALRTLSGVAFEVTSQRFPQAFVRLLVPVSETGEIPYRLSRLFPPPQHRRPGVRARSCRGRRAMFTLGLPRANCYHGLSERGSAPHDCERPPRSRRLAT